MGGWVEGRALGRLGSLPPSPPPVMSVSWNSGGRSGLGLQIGEGMDCKDMPRGRKGPAVKETGHHHS